MKSRDKMGFDASRRDFLVSVTAAMGIAGLGVAAIPFVKAMNPTKDLIAAGVQEIDISDLMEGELKTVIWRKQPVFILRRSEIMVRKTDAIDPDLLKDSATSLERTIRPDIFVSFAICTHLGCIPKFRPQNVEGTDQPGFYCPCHGGKYDTLGRRLDGPPPENLHLLPYHIRNNSLLIIGTEKFAGYGENIRRVQKLPTL